MPDNLKIKRPEDAARVNIHEPYEVNWWTKELNCNKAQLEAAVKAAGTSVAKVREQLKKK